MEVRLTRDAEKLIALIYKQYLERRKNGAFREDAKSFGSSKELKDLLHLDAPIEDLDSFCYELSNYGYLSVLSADDTAYEITLTNAGIADLERRFTDGLKSVVEFLTKFV